MSDTSVWNNINELMFTYNCFWSFQSFLVLSRFYKTWKLMLLKSKFCWFSISFIRKIMQSNISKGDCRKLVLTRAFILILSTCIFKIFSVMNKICDVCDNWILWYVFNSILCVIVFDYTFCKFYKVNFIRYLLFYFINSVRK